MCDGNGLAVFQLIRRERTSATAVHCAFDLLGLDGEELRPAADRAPQGVAGKGAVRPRRRPSS